MHSSIRFVGLPVRPQVVALDADASLAIVAVTSTNALVHRIGAL